MNAFLIILWYFIIGSSKTVAEDDCPAGCSCIRQTINCRRTGMLSVPKLPRFVPGPEGGALQFLQVSQNPMIRLERASFEGLEDLLRIELSFNQLIWISKEAFVGLKSLRSLSLRGNRIAYLPHDVFTPVFILEDLDLSRNQLTSIPFSVEGLIYLRRLSLFANPLHCPCEMVDFSVSLIHLEPVRSRVTCQGPTQVTHIQAAELGKRLASVVRNTRLMGYQHISELDKEEVIRRLPYRPHPRELQHTWPWPHCPVHDFGGTEPKIGKTTESDETEELSNKESNPYVYQEQTTEVIRWRDIPQDMEVVAGGTARFICGADGPVGTQISWLLPINATTHIRLHRRRQILEIVEVHDYHEGIYTCVVYNRQGEHLLADAKLRLIPAIKPRIIDAPPADQNTIVEGEDLELRCAAHGRPRPRISWLWQEDTLPLHLVTGGRYIVRSVATGLERMLPVGSSIYLTNEYLKSAVEASETNSYLLIRNVTKRDAHGRYVCYASNSVGSARVTTVIHVVSPRELNRHDSTSDISQITPQVNGSETLSGEELVRHVIEKARLRIDAAIKRTADRLRDPSRRRSSADVASLFRQPSRAALELAKAAEVYEAAIDEVTSILRQRNQQNLEVSGTEEQIKFFEDKDLDPNSRDVLGTQLSADQLAIISQLSGCQQSSNIDPCSHQLCFHLRYRSIDGACNNFNHPRWGAALVPFKRLLPPQYENGVNTPVGWTPSRLYFGYPKPSARIVSVALLGNATLLGRHTQRLRQLADWENRHVRQTVKEDFPSAPETQSLSLKYRFEMARNRSMEFQKLHGAFFDEDDEYSGMLMQWGQFLDHDLDFTPVDASISRFSDGLNCNDTCVNDPPCFPIMVPPDDPRIKHRCIGFARSSATCGSGSTSILLGKPHYREQLNQITSFIDASNVYGSEEFENSQLRETLHDEGKLRTGMPTPAGKRLMPFNIRGQVDCQADPQQDFVPCFKAGDHRSNENLGLLSMHTLWVREHNRLADGLRSLNPDWSGDRIYQEARKIVGACMQAITMQAWLPIILGPEGIKLMGTYKGYDDRINPTISNEFATAAMRFGHTLVPPVVFRLDENWQSISEGHLSLHQAFFAPDRMLKDGGMDPILRGLLFNGVRDRSRNPPLNVELTERLFAMAHELALDLAALNVQRGRDHGLAGYTEYAYKVCGLGNSPHPDTFDELAVRISNPDTRERLRQVYGHPGNIDLFTGGILEDLLPDARVGPTFACIIADQFKRLRDGDRFWYEYQGVFTHAQLAELRKAGSSLSRVICENADNITEVPKNAFMRPTKPDDMVLCNKVPKLNLAAWVDCTPTPYESRVEEPGRVRRRRSVMFEARDSPSDMPSCPRNKISSSERIRKLTESLRDLQDRFEQLSRMFHEMKFHNTSIV